MMIKCPDNAMQKEARIRCVLEQFNDWIADMYLEELISATGGNMPRFSGFYDKFEWVYNYSRQWDFRKKNAESLERWSIRNEGIYERNKDKIIDLAIKMGYGDVDLTCEDTTQLIILGGARMSNYSRCLVAKKVFDVCKVKPRRVVALSGLRKLDEVEYPYIDKYAKGAKTEYEAITMALLQVFDVKNEIIKESKELKENENLSWIIKKFPDKMAEIYSLAAPSSDPRRRANSYDTFEFLLKCLDITKEDKITMVTSSIYAPFQNIRFLPLAIEKNLNIDFVGGASGAFLDAANYCQEIKATIDAMKEFIEKYSEWKI